MAYFPKWLCDLTKKRIAKGKLAVWLATDERAFSGELHLCIEGYCCRESRAKIVANVRCHFKMFSKPLSPFLEPKTNKHVFQNEPEVLPCFELNYKFLERHKKPISLTRTTDLVRLTLLLICQRNDSFDSWLWNGFLERALRIKPTEQYYYYCCFLFFLFYSIMRLKENSLRGSWIPR